MRSLFTTILLLGLAHFTLLPVAVAQQDPFAGKYKLLIPALTTANPDKIEVTELFWYTCPHCYHFEKYAKPWAAKLPSDVAFVLMPAVFSDKNVPYAALFYTAETLGVLDKVHTPIFEAIHKEKRQLDEAALQAIFQEHAGVSPEDFKATYESFAVVTKVNRARNFTAKSRITGVPALVVNGRYRLINREIGGHAQMLQVVDHLVEKERNRLQAAPKQVKQTLPEVTTTTAAEPES